MDSKTSDRCVYGEAHIPEPLAIVGTGMKLPGQIRTIEDRWTLLVEKRSTRSKVPEDRFNVDAFYSESGRLGAMRTVRALPHGTQLFGASRHAYVSHDEERA